MNERNKFVSEGFESSSHLQINRTLKENEVRNKKKEVQPELRTHQKTRKPSMDLLRFSTAGSVDDGKSTLIGRLLYDCKSIFEDQLEALQNTTLSRGEDGMNLALLTDGLRAEREQGITIDVAYRYFATPRRKFIIADTPGHEQYTRNMVTGASTADLAIILIDARKGLLTQSRRHAFISSLLQIPHLVVAVNKMDLVQYSEERFFEIVEEFTMFAENLAVKDISFFPISALHGDNLVNKSINMPWYKGSTLLYHLEYVRVDSRKNPHDFRFPVQYVIRPDQDYRGFAGRIVSGSIQVGETITILPGREHSQIVSIANPDGKVEKARAGESVVLEIAHNIDISRGDMIVRINNVPETGTRFEATLCWMDKEPLSSGKRYLIQHTTRVANAILNNIRYRISVDTLKREQAGKLELNEIGRVCVETAQPLFFDAYSLNNATGSFILVDPNSNVTVAAGMIRSSSTNAREEEKLCPDNKSKMLWKAEEDSGKRSRKKTVAGAERKSTHVIWESWNISRSSREKRNGHKAKVLWFTGPSGAGKSTIARAMEKKLWKLGKQTMLLDGDQLRHGLNGDLGFTPVQRKENIRRAAEVAKLFFEHGNIVLCSFVSPYRKDREAVRALFPEGAFFEIHIHARSGTLAQRDPKGLYRKAKAGEIQDLTGFDGTYEPPELPALAIDTDLVHPEEAVWQIMTKFFTNEQMSGQ